MHGYWRTVLVAIGFCFGLGMLWQIVGVVRAIRGLVEGKATGVGFVAGGLIEFLITAVVLGWILGSAWYMLRR